MGEVATLSAAWRITMVETRFTEFPLPVPMTNGMWGTMMRLFDPPDNDEKTYIVGKADAQPTPTIRVYSEGNVENIHAYLSGQKEGAPCTSFQVITLGDKPFLAVWFDLWYGKLDFAVSQRIKDGKFGDRIWLPKRPHIIRGAKGWGWTKLSDLMKLLDADPKGVIPYWNFVIGLRDYCPKPPPELTETGKVGSETEDDDEEFYLYEDDLLNWYENNTSKFNGITITLDDPKSEMMQVGDSRDIASILQYERPIPVEADISKIDFERIWVPAELAICLLEIDFFIRLKCGRS